MHFTSRSVLFVSMMAVASCVPVSDPGGSPEPGTGGSRPGTGGAPGSSTGGRPATGGTSGGTGGAATGGAGPTGTGGTASDDASAGTGGAAPDTNTTAPDSGETGADGPTGPGTIPTNLDGPIPPWDGPPVGPEVKMDCPGDPTAGYTEYKDTFKVEHPYDLPTSARFSIDAGIYNFWVMQGDKRHNPNSTARNPRTEARWSQNFRTGTRMWSADIYWDKSVANGTVVMQVHTTTTGIGPVYMVANGNGVSPLDASKVPGGLYNRWINLKVSINAQTTGSQYWVNNCLVTTRGSGTRGDGNNYFKVGVYHCDSGTCRAKVKNIHLYQKP